MLVTKTTFKPPMLGDRPCVSDLDYFIYVADNDFKSGNFYLDKALIDVKKAYNQAKKDRTVKSFREQLEKELARMVDFSQYAKPKLQKLST